MEHAANKSERPARSRMAKNICIAAIVVSLGLAALLYWFLYGLMNSFGHHTDSFWIFTEMDLFTLVFFATPTVSCVTAAAGIVYYYRGHEAALIVQFMFMLVSSLILIFLLWSMFRGLLSQTGSAMPVEVYDILYLGGIPCFLLVIATTINAVSKKMPGIEKTLRL